jgi:hypothetical protein
MHYPHFRGPSHCDSLWLITSCEPIPATSCHSKLAARLPKLKARSTVAGPSSPHLSMLAHFLAVLHIPLLWSAMRWYHLPCAPAQSTPLRKLPVSPRFLFSIVTTLPVHTNADMLGKERSRGCCNRLMRLISEQSLRFRSANLREMMYSSCAGAANRGCGLC